MIRKHKPKKNSPLMNTIFFMSLLGWLYAIGYQFAYPIGISNGDPLSIHYPLNLIRVDQFGIVCFAATGVSHYLKQKV